MRQPYDFCYGMNWVEQLRSALAVRRYYIYRDGRSDWAMIDNRFTWMFTPQGHDVWNKRDYALRMAETRWHDNLVR